MDHLFANVGPVMTKFTIALREIGTYKEVLRSQVILIFMHSTNFAKYYGDFLQINAFFLKPLW